MNLPSNVKSKGWLGSVFPISRYTAHAIYPNIFVPRSVFDDLQSDNPDPANVSVLIHEQTHIARMKKAGWIWWGIKYMFNSKFRYQEELAAICESAKYLKSKGKSFDTERKARFLSSWLYLWCVSYSRAKRDLDKFV